VIIEGILLDDLLARRPDPRQPRYQGFALYHWGRGGGLGAPDSFAAAGAGGGAAVRTLVVHPPSFTGAAGSATGAAGSAVSAAAVSCTSSTGAAATAVAPTGAGATACGPGSSAVDV
jgi:hypothetical protein